MKLIPLIHSSLSLSAIVSDADYDSLVAGGPWYAVSGSQGGHYAVRYVKHAGKRSKSFESMQRHLLALERGDQREGDHRDRNTLNNQRDNLRIATRMQNASNVGKRSHNTSGFKGVFWHKIAGRWAAQIRANKKQHFLGLFDTPDAAHAAYCEAAANLHGDFAFSDSDIDISAIKRDPNWKPVKPARRVQPPGSSGIRGVSFCGQHGRWRAYTKGLNGKRKCLGFHDTAELAAAARAAYLNSNHQHPIGISP